MISQTEMGVYTTPYKLVTCEKIGGMSFAKIVFLVREHLSEKISVCFVHLIQSLLIQRSPHLRLRRRKSGGCSETGTRSWLVTTANRTAWTRSLEHSSVKLSLRQYSHSRSCVLCIYAPALDSYLHFLQSGAAALVWFNPSIRLEFLLPVRSCVGHW